MRYYDEMTAGCTGCRYLQPGAFPGGKSYQACRWYGYILHPEKGISQEACPARRTDEEPEPAPAARSMRQLKRQKRNG